MESNKDSQNHSLKTLSSRCGLAGGSGKRATIKRLLKLLNALIPMIGALQSCNGTLALYSRKENQMSNSMIEKVKLARRAGRVQRYHQHALIRPENVAEHTFGLVNLLMIMTDRQVTAKLLMAAIAHDMGEYVSGDIPSPIKHGAGKDFKDIINKIEDGAMHDIHGKEWEELSDWEYLLLKTADNLDGLFKCVDERSLSNSGVIPIGDKYAEYLEAQLPALGGGPAAELVRQALFDWRWSHK